MPRPAATRADAVSDGCGRLVGDGSALQIVKTFLLRVAACESNVLITGETGTGKELVAELIHENSARRQKPFVRINCPAIPENLIESELFGHERGAFTGAESLKEGMLRSANGGTIFFDEIGDLSAPAQGKILRSVETKEIHPLGSTRTLPVDLRVLAATNRDLDRLAEEGGFRQDLYFRLNVLRIHLPPLRERKEDIPTLLRHFTLEFNRLRERDIEGFSDEALDLLFRYDWPGNVRELKNLVEACFLSVSARRIAVDDMPDHFRQRLKRAGNGHGDERERLLSTLTATKWNKSNAALKLHCSRMTLYRKMARHHIPNARGADRT